MTETTQGADARELRFMLEALDDLVSAVQDDCASWEHGNGRRLKEVREARQEVHRIHAAALERVEALEWDEIDSAVQQVLIDHACEQRTLDEATTEIRSLYASRFAVERARINDMEESWLERSKICYANGRRQAADTFDQCAEEISSAFSTPAPAGEKGGDQ